MMIHTRDGHRFQRLVFTTRGFLEVSLVSSCTMSTDSTTSPRAPREAAKPVVRIGEKTVKYVAGDCEALGKASIKCIEDHGFNRAHPACQVHYDAYKECRRKENEARRAANANRSFFG